MKKLLSLLLAVMMLASCIPAFADDTWKITPEGALSVNSGVKLSGEVVIPETVDGITVTSLDGFAFNNQTDVTSIVMPDTVQSMGSGAINFLDGVTSLKLSENLMVISDMNGILKGLTELTIPASVRYIGDAFTSMKSMQTLTFEGVCPVFNSQDPLHGISSSAVIYVPDDQVDAYKAALAGGYDIDELVQPSGKNAVVHSNPAAESDFVFDATTGTITGYTGVAAFLEIPAAIGGTPVKAIGEKAFYDNAALFYVIIPEGIESIGNSAFTYCDSLTVVEFPTTLKKIGDNAFDGCYLDYVGWAEGLEEIGANAFARLAIRDVRLPSTVKTIGEAAFENGTITNLYIGNAIESIGAEAFANNCIEYIELLTDRMIQIDETAFAGNTYETYIYLGWKASYDVFEEYEHLFLNIYDGSTYLYVQAPIKDTSLGLEYPYDGTDSYNQDVWVSYNGTQPNLMTWYSWNRIPLTTLGDGLFKGNQTIRSWYPTHSFTVHHIGNEAFADSSVEIVDLYYGIETIGDAAFRNCVNIKEITLPETLTSIAANAFEGCTGLEKITILCDPSVIPQGLLDTCTALTEISAGSNATAEQNQQLQFALYGMPEVTITQQPVDMIVAEGEQASATIQATGESLTYAWYYGKDGDFNLSEDNTGDTYSVEMNDERSGRQVYCVVTDAYGTSATSEIATLRMITPLKLREHPASVTAAEGENANLYVEARGDGLSYAWYINDAAVEGATGESFTVTMTPDYDGAQVHCVVTDAYGNSIASEKAILTLKVVVPFEIVSQPVDVELPEGEMSNITVEATGEGLTYQWYVMPGDANDYVAAEGFTTNVYSVPVDAASDWSRVYCVITDASGNKLESDKVNIFMAATEEAAPAIEVPEGSVDPAMVGHWVATGAEVEGMVMDQAMLEQFGMNIWIDLYADGTAVMFMEGEEMGGIQWMVAEGALYLSLYGDVMPIAISADGTLNFEGVIIEKQDGAAPTEAAPAEEMSDEEALMALMAMMAEMEETEGVEEAAPAAVADDGFVGTWHMVYTTTGGFTGDLRPMGVTATLVLNADGTGTFDFLELTSGIWYEQDGFTYFGQGGDNADMPMALMDGGFLQYGSDLGGYIVFSQDANAEWDPSMGTALIAPGMDSFETPMPAAPAAPAETITDVNARLERKFVVTSYTSMGQDFDASMLGTEYSVIFHENGTCDFTMAGMAMPNLPWGMQKVAVGLNEVDAFVINYYGMMFNAVLTDTGFDMDYYGTMNLHFVPAE